MASNMVQGSVLPARASTLAQQGRTRGFKAPPKVAVVCRASAQSSGKTPRPPSPALLRTCPPCRRVGLAFRIGLRRGERDTKAMLASAALAAAMLVTQVPACHAYAYPELFGGGT
eukprot:1193240-Prorocentrum_minimum.AAC.1